MPIRTIFACAALALAAPRSPAQSVSWLWASAGVEQSAQRNSGESPYVYSGFGGTLTLGYGRDTRAASFDISAAGSLGSLTSSVTTGIADHGTGDLSLRTLHALAAHFAGASWMLGARLDGTVDATTQRYPLYGLTDDFGYLDLGLAPAVRTIYRWKNATITNDLSVPVASFIDVPYSNSRAQGSHVTMAFASLSTLQAFDDEISYRVGPADARHMAWIYRVSLLRYALVDSRRFARQSLSLAFDVPVSRSRR